MRESRSIISAFLIATIVSIGVVAILIIFNPQMFPQAPDKCDEAISFSSDLSSAIRQSDNIAPSQLTDLKSLSKELDLLIAACRRSSR